MMKLVSFASILAGLAIAAPANAASIIENFEGSSAGSSTPPSGWSLVQTAGTATYVTSAAGAGSNGSNGSGGSSGLAGQVTATAGVGNNGLPGAYLVSTQTVNLTGALSGTFDFRLIHESTFDDVGFILGDVANGITGTSAGELLYARITEGGSGYFIYRPALNSQLLAAGYRFEFVGSKTNTQGGVTLKHEGYAGKRADQIATLLAGTFPSNIADIVLLHAGHNNDVTIDTEAVILDRVETATRSMIATARSHNPDVIVLLAQVITSSKLPKYSYIPALNLRLAEVAADLDSAQQPVMIVNQADGWDPVADTVDDGVHPTEGGATKMANKWFVALEPLLE